MKSLSLLLANSLVSFLVVVAQQLSSTLPAIGLQGRHFVNQDTGDVFLLKGIDYQPGGSSANGDIDVLSDADICARDIYLFQQLGINTIRVYSIDTDTDHNECMSMLAAAGIYVILDINSSQQYRHLDRDQPWTTYTSEYLRNLFKVVEEFANFNNTLAFFAGNEVVNANTSAQYSPPYVKAVVRDVKQYIKNHINRTIPVGYAAADDLAYRESLSQYLQCGSDIESVDFYGVNSYQWCGRQSFQTSGYDVLVEDYSNYSIPVILSEFGCIEVRPRTFQETEAIFSNDMWNVFSGGLAYEYSEETNNYGLVKIDDDGSAEMLDDFDALSKQYANANSTFPYSQLSSVGTSVDRPETCEDSYPNIDINDNQIPDCPDDDLVENGLNKPYAGKFIAVSKLKTSSNYTITDVDGSTVNANIEYKINIPDTDVPEGRTDDIDDQDDDTSGGTTSATGTATTTTSSSAATTTAATSSASGSGTASAASASASKKNAADSINVKKTLALLGICLVASVAFLS